MFPRYFPRFHLITSRCFCSKSTKSSDLHKLLLKMKIDPEVGVQFYKRRIEMIKNSRYYVPRTIYLQVLGCGTIGAPASVYLFSDQSSYLFNCGEGTQRLAHEYKAKLTRIQHIFLTRSSWDRSGGLPGLCLTLQSNNISNLTLHGPDGLGQLFDTMQRFANLKHLKVESPLCEDGIIYDDQVLSVHGIKCKKKAFDGTSDNENSSQTTVHQYTDETDDSNNEISSSTVPLGKKHFGSTVMSFICRLKPRLGSLDLHRCVKANVPPGPLLEELINGKSVILPDGTTVHSKDVFVGSRLDPDPGRIFILIDIPSADFLDSFMEKQHFFTAHQTADNSNDLASLVVHMSPQYVIDTPVYQNFISKFPESTKHLVLNETNKFSGFVSSHRIQIQLNQLNDSIFPTLGEYHEMETQENIARNNKQYESGEAHSTRKTSDNGVRLTKCKYEHVSAATLYHLRPNKGLDRSNEIKICPARYATESAAIPGFIDSLDNLKRLLKNSYANETISRSKEYPRILFLGTGSSLPMKNRNVSAILVHTKANASILLDCGEGTFGQIIRFYGITNAKKVLRDLKAIYISHLHPDHFIGLIGLLKERRHLLGRDASPIMLLAPYQILPLLDFYEERIDFVKSEYSLIPNSELFGEPLIDERFAELGLNYISTCLVDHCPHAFGIAFEINSSEPFKITYSGDTTPCNELVRLGKDSNLLIHEATYDDKFKQHPRHPPHSTVSEAIEQGVKMNAKFTMLTHFSQRYKVPTIESSVDTNFGIAFDNMEVTRKDLKYLHLLFPTFKVLFTKGEAVVERV